MDENGVRRVGHATKDDIHTGDSAVKIETRVLKRPFSRSMTPLNTTFCIDRSDHQAVTTVTAPSGRTYTATPGAALLFPQLSAPTEALTYPRTPPLHPLLAGWQCPPASAPGHRTSPTE